MVIRQCRMVMLAAPARLLMGLIVFAMCQVTARAQGNDVVKVKDGDQYRGTVQSLVRGDLSLSTDAAGTIDINWSKVVTISSKEMLDVDTSSGMRYTGTISSPADGQLVVQTASGPTKPIPLSEVVRIRSVSATFFERTTGSVDFGLTVTKDTVTYALEGTANNRTRSYETDLTVESFLSQQDEGVTETRNSVVFDTRKIFVNRWFIVGTAQYLQADELELDWRTVFGGGAGRVLRETPATLLQAEGGIEYNAENFTSALETDHSAEVFGAVDWEWSGGTSEASLDARTAISLERARVRFEFDAKVRRDIFWNLYWSVNAFDDFDSDPPDDRPQSTFGLTIGLGWSF